MNLETANEKYVEKSSQAFGLWRISELLNVRSPKAFRVRKRKEKLFRERQDILGGLTGACETRPMQ